MDIEQSLYDTYREIIEETDEDEYWNGYYYLRGNTKEWQFRILEQWLYLNPVFIRRVNRNKFR